MMRRPTCPVCSRPTFGLLRALFERLRGRLWQAACDVRYRCRLHRRDAEPPCRGAVVVRVVDSVGPGMSIYLRPADGSFSGDASVGPRVGVVEHVLGSGLAAVRIAPALGLPRLGDVEPHIGAVQP